MLKKLLFVTALIFTAVIAVAQSFAVQPYLEKATPNSFHITWETSGDGDSFVDWGLTDELSNSMEVGSTLTLLPGYLHEIELLGLTPATNYFYRVRTGSLESDIFQFRTPDENDQEESFRIVAMSDMQHDGGNPTIFNEIVNEGVIPTVEDQYGPEIHEELGMAIIPGDLVDNGLSYWQWNETFFGPAHPLFANIPVYPVPGNHEANSPYFFDYFHLPENGVDGLEEHAWYLDRSNIRIIGLDSNWPYADGEELDWLELTLDDACSNELIDFVFVQLHHPHKSELWLPGETDFTGSVVELCENFTEECGKPSIHFFGHTHGYSRGQSIDHHHLWVNVATAGGNIDYWGEYAQADYPEFTVSQDEYGFVLVEVEAGDEPKFVLKRYGQGDEFNPNPPELRDSISVILNNESPGSPTGIFPNDELVNPDCVVLVASEYTDADGNDHMAAQWELYEDCDTLSDPIHTAYRTHENWYFGVDTQADDDLTDEEVNGLNEYSSYCWRVRYRDHGLSWSSWSSFIPFETWESSLTPNLLDNPGAENGTNDWEVTAGFLESLTAGECAGTDPYEGTYYFAVGALCDESAFGEAYQDVDLSDFADDIDEGDALLFYGGQLSDWNGSDIPEIQAVFMDENDAEIGAGAAISVQIPEWTAMHATESIPAGTAKVKLFIRGYRNAGTDNDSYIDNLYLQVNPTGCGEVITHLAEEPSKRDVEIFPNPLTAETRIVVPENTAHLDVKIYDSMGRMVFEQSHIHGHELAIGHLDFEIGNYVAVIHFDDIPRILKFNVSE